MDSSLRENLAAYEVVWDSPSEDSSGSMPIGNGDLVANVWVEPSGDLVLLLAKNDAVDENGKLLKLGRVRIRTTPRLLSGEGEFGQRLKLMNGEVRIGAPVMGGSLNIRIWVDANRPVLHVESKGAAHEVKAVVESWRTTERAVESEASDLFRNGNGEDPYPTIVSADQFLSSRRADAVLWCHHNAQRTQDGYAVNMHLQGLDEAMKNNPHPLALRTFGAMVHGEGFAAIGDRMVQSQGEAEGRHLQIVALMQQPSTVGQWQEAIEKLAGELSGVELEVARREHERWWEQFWSRSWIFVQGGAEDAVDVTRGYVLQRFMNAAAGRGPVPIKFNGSLFSVGREGDPDYRKWGGPGYWFQNQRLVYWPMLACGDYDLLEPWVQMYRRSLGVQKLRTRKYFGHEGAHYPETITFWGAEISGHYGWTAFVDRTTPEAESGYVRYYWSGGLELSLILYERWLYTQDEKFAREVLLPVADEVTLFFDLHYPRDEAGKIHFEPSQSLETWHVAVNPLPDIAALKYLLPKLAEMPQSLTNEEQRARWERMMGELPPVPQGVVEGKKVLLPAEIYSEQKNHENPELYAVFPYRLYGVGKDGLEVARDTFDKRQYRMSICWFQDEIQMALLGMVEECRAGMASRASGKSASDSRFPAFWNAFHDWIPDMDHGGALQMALQYMLMQCEGREIRLLPAWPDGWDCDFRLHAPYQTVVQAKVRKGKIVELEVTPPQRREDIVGMGERMKYEG